MRDSAQQETTHIGTPEQAADELLASAGRLGRRHGVYTTAQIERKIRLEDRRLPRLAECDVPDEIRQYLLERHLDDLLEVSRLSAAEEAVFRLYVAGLSCRDMAATLKLNYHVVASHFTTARRKVRTAYREGRYAGWYEVYLSEVNRPAYRARHRP